MKIIGIDLSGPSNTADTVCVICEAEGAGLRVVDCVSGATDQDVVAILAAFEPCEDVAIGLDAPLSYQPGGGDRTRICGRRWSGPACLPPAS
jgi:predicted RNase H-like nuclease